MSVARPPHGESCPRCYPEPSWGTAAATAGTVLAIVVFWVAGTVIGLNLAAWAQVHP